MGVIMPVRALRREATGRIGPGADAAAGGPRGTAAGRFIERDFPTTVCNCTI
jgi:hypothetical protein